ncbi:coiled-coil domain-containing protein [Paenibacillus stellifer]|uniref:coiled-coil domain-containing protein n=1 Tax=Paenibacillus stellifer TaxID=169760 RepID=UPI0006925792|nr:hypothetical protein [Paenibacillus stellifer]
MTCPDWRRRTLHTYKKLKPLLLLPLCFLLLIPPASRSLAGSAGPSATPSAATAPSSPSSLSAFPDTEETRRLMQQTLSKTEIQKEIDRISAEQSKLAEKSADLRKQADRKQADIEDKRKRAGAVVRAYYTGDREPWITAFLSADTLSSWFVLLDYYEIIMGRDKEILADYEKDYRDLQRTLAAADRSYQELDGLKKSLEEQKNRVDALNREIEGGINESEDPSGMASLLEEFTIYWQNVGLHEIKTYFKALSKAMDKLPEFVEGRDDILTRKGMKYELNLKQEDLNTFLRSQNDMFNQFGFTFKNDQVLVSGTNGDLSMTLTGHYSVQDEPVNGIMFHVDSIIFNGLQLPDTTCRELEKEFDLGFYPSQFISLLKTTEVSSRDGVLHVELAIKF